MRRKTRGFALLQALFFMMFIMAIISMTMMMNAQRHVGASGERMALDAYPAVSAFLNYVVETVPPTRTTPILASEYFNTNPLSDKYIQELIADGFIATTAEGNLSALSIVIKN